MPTCGQLFQIADPPKSPTLVKILHSNSIHSATPEFHFPFPSIADRCRPLCINLLHDPLCPLNRSGDHGRQFGDCPASRQINPLPFSGDALRRVPKRAARHIAVVLAANRRDEHQEGTGVSAGGRPAVLGSGEGRCRVL